MDNQKGSFSMATYIELVNAILNGETQRERELLIKSTPMLYNRAEKIMGNAEDAEQVLFRTWTAILDQLGALRWNVQDYPAFACRILQEECKSVLTERKHGESPKPTSEEIHETVIYCRGDSPTDKDHKFRGLLWKVYQDVWKCESITF